MPRSKIIYGDEVLIDLTGDTVQPETLGVGVTAHDAAGNPITGTMTGGKPEQTKTVTPKASAQTVTPDSGYTLSSVTVNAVPTQTKTATPSAASQDVTPDSGKFLSKVTVSGDSNLVAGNIKSGVSIFGVAGSFEGSGGGSGGGSLDTCTVEILCQDQIELKDVATSIVEDGKIEPYFNTVLPGNGPLYSLTIDNVLCSSSLLLIVGGRSIIGASYDNMTPAGQFANGIGSASTIRTIKAPTEAGTVGRVTLYDND